MDTPTSITNIKNTIESIKAEMKNVDVSQHDGQFFGSEAKYTYKELLNELNSLMLNIGILLKNPKQFLEISTYAERNNVNNALSESVNFLHDPNHYAYVEALKQHIRPFSPYYTNDQLINLKTTLDKYDKKLEQQNKKHKEYDIKIKEYNAEKDKTIKSLKNEQKQLFEAAETIIKQAKESLSLNSSIGIGKFFQERLKVAEKARSWFWIVAASLFIVAGTTLTVLFILKNPNTDFSTTLTRLSIISLPLAGAWFCAGQYTKLKNIAEDYAYKTVLAQSIIGFSEQLKDGEDNNSYKEYIKKMLDEIHQHPVPKHKKETENETLITKNYKNSK